MVRVQDSMRAIAKEVLSDLQNELNAIRGEVVKKVEEVGRTAIEKVK